MPSIAIEVRPAIVGALLLTLGLAVGLECAPRSECRGRTVAVVRMQPPVIESMRIVPPHAPSLPGDIFDPGDHADARPWPHGMVIAPPPTHDAIQAALTGPIAGPASPIARSIERLVNTLIATLVPQSS